MIRLAWRSLLTVTACCGMAMSFLLTGCAQTGAQTQQGKGSAAVPPSPPPDVWRLSAITRDREIGGAAYRLPAHVHVLINKPYTAENPVNAGDFHSLQSHGEDSPSGQMAGQTLAAGKKGEEPDSRLIDAWKRYCSGGAGMTEEDWEIIEASTMPAAFAGKCVHPK